MGVVRITRHNFKLNFQYSTKVQYLPSMNITRSPYHFVHISYIVGGTFETDYLPGDILNFVVLNFFTLLSRITFNNLIVVLFRVIFCPFVVRISCNINNIFSIFKNITKIIIITIHMLQLADDLILKIK